MAFDLSSAAPVTGGGFDLSTAKPADDGEQSARQSPRAMEEQIRREMAERRQSVVHGAMNPVFGLTQLATAAMPASVVKAGNEFNNWLVDKGVPLARVPEGGIDELTRKREDEYQAWRSAHGKTGFDAASAGGSMLSPLNFVPAAAAARIGVPLSLVGKTALGAGQGAVAGATQPVTQGDSFWTEKGKQVGEGAVIGGAMPAAAAGAARVIRPQTAPAVKSLIQEGVTMTPGQILGSGWQRMEDAATSLPIVGDAIKSAQRKGVTTFNRAAINRSLEPIGEKLPKGLDAGNEAIGHAVRKLDEAYDNLLPKMGGKFDQQLSNEFALVRQMGQNGNWPKQQKAQLDRIMKTEIIDRFANGGVAAGETIKDIDSKLGGLWRDFRRSDNYDVRSLGDAVHELQASLRRMIDRANPQYGPELSKINQGYANLLRVQKAGAMQGAREGIFTPSQLRSAVREMDKSKNKRAFAKGDALMQDLTDAGQDRLSQTVPDSGTPLRAIVNASILGGSTLVPHGMPAAGAALGAASMYTPPGLWAMQKMLTARPGAAVPLSQLTRQLGGPLATPGAVSAAEQ
jgi:hypothetical protein